MYQGNVIKHQSSELKDKKEKETEQKKFDEVYLSAVLGIADSLDATIYYTKEVKKEKEAASVALSKLYFETPITEKTKLNDIISSQFQLTDIEVTEIIQHALLLCENATDFYQFTSKINENYSLEQRIKMLELLWQVAYADGELASIEEHIIRKIADLLHLRHSEYIQTKLNSQEKQQNKK